MREVPKQLAEKGTWVQQHWTFLRLPLVPFVLYSDCFPLPESPLRALGKTPNFSLRRRTAPRECCFQGSTHTSKLLAKMAQYDAEAYQDAT